VQKFLIIFFNDFAVATIFFANTSLQ